ncbi:MAG: DMT family transporter [Rhizobiaceae bacterium]
MTAEISPASGLDADRKLYAALIMLGCIGASALQDAYLKQLSGAYPFHQMQFMRSFVAVSMMSVWLIWRHGVGFLKGTFSPVLIVRGLLISFGSLFFYLGLAAMTMAEAVSIYFVLPMMVVALSGVVLREKVRTQRWIAAAIGFSGVLVIVQPNSSLFNWASVLPLIATVFYALGHMLTRKVDRALPPMITAFYTGMSFVAVAAVLSLIFGFGMFATDAHPSLAFLTRGWVMPNLRDGVVIVFVGVLTMAGFFGYVQAYRLAPPSFVAPFEYSALIWAVVLGFSFFNDIPNVPTLWGSAIIVMAGFFLGWQERRAGHRLIR